MKSSYSQLKRVIANPVLIFIAAPGLLFIPVLIRGQALFWGTPSMQFVPWWDFAFSSLLNGELPLWNPWVGMGAPLIANYQSALFYPPYWFLLIVYAIAGLKGMAWSITLIVIFHLAWAGIGTGKLLDDLGIGKLGQAVGGLSFALSGYLVARAGFLSINAAAAWLPWILLYSYRLAIGYKSSLIKLAIILALQLLAGHAQTAWYSFLMAGLWSLFWIWKANAKGRSWTNLLEAGGKFALSGLIAGGLSAVQLMPTYAYLLQSQRAADYGFAQAMTYSFWPWRFLTLAAPHLFGTPAQDNYWGYGNYWEDAIYIGLLPIIFALIMILRSLRKGIGGTEHPGRRHAQLINFLFTLVVFSFILALGDNSPIFPFLYRHIPTFDLFQAPTRFSLVAVMALSVIAGIGSEAIGKPQGKARYWSNLAAAGCFAISLGATIGYFFLENIKSTFFGSIGLAGAIGFVGVLMILNKPAPDQERNFKIWKRALIALITMDLLIAGWGLNPGIDLDFYQPEIPLKTKARVWIAPGVEHDLKFKEFFLFDTFDSQSPLSAVYTYPLPNTGMLIKQETVNNFDPILPARFNTWMTFTEDLISTPDHPAFTLMGSEILVTKQGALDNRNHLPELIDSGYLAIAEMMGLSEPEEMLGAIKAWEPTDRIPILIESGQSGNLECSRQGAGKINLLARTPSYLKAELILEKDSWIFWSQNWMPGWNYYLDGVEMGPLLKGNYTFMAACIPAGESVVEFMYQPLSIRIGAFVTLASLSLILGIFLLNKRADE